MVGSSRGVVPTWPPAASVAWKNYNRRGKLRVAGHRRSFAMDDNPYESPKTDDAPQRRRGRFYWKPKDIFDFAGYGALFGIVAAPVVAFCLWAFFSSPSARHIDELPGGMLCCTVPAGSVGLLCGVVIWAMRNWK